MFFWKCFLREQEMTSFQNEIVSHLAKRSTILGNKPTEGRI